MVLLGRLFPKTIGFTHGWNRTNHVNFMKVRSKLQPVLCVLYITTFVWSIFQYNWYVLQHSAMKRTYRLISLHYNMRTIPMITFHLINTRATSLWFSFLAYKLPYMKFHEEHFLSQKFFSTPNRTRDIKEKLNLGYQHATVHRAEQLRGENFQRLLRTPTWHIFIKSCFPPKNVF